MKNAELWDDTIHTLGMKENGEEQNVSYEIVVQEEVSELMLEENTNLVRPGCIKTKLIVVMDLNSISKLCQNKTIMS
jgi:hypothetical protein